MQCTEKPWLKVKDKRVIKTFKWQAINAFLYQFFQNNSKNTKLEQVKPRLDNV